MKILSTKRTVKLIDTVAVNEGNPSYLYELTNDGSINQRHGMILDTIKNTLARKDLLLDNAIILDGYNFHNICVSAMGPYIVKPNGEQVYTFRSDKTLVKLDPGMTHPAKDYHVKFPKQIYACVSYEKEGTIKGIDYLVILNSGLIRFMFKPTPSNFTMSVLSDKELTSEITKHLLHKVGQNTTDVVNNNPAIGFKNLLDLLDEVDTNGSITDCNS